MKADFSGYVTKAGLKCTDGRTITPDAFKHQDKAKVPLVWQHGRTDVEQVLGHVMLEHRSDGMYGYGFFNDSSKAKHSHSALEHGDITMMSIWANQLIERAGMVLHGAIREVSLVLSGANPGAIIENVTLRHDDGEETTVEDEAIIYTGLEFEIEHAAGPSDETIQDVYDSMTDKQKEVLHYMLGAALDNAGQASQSDLETEQGKEEKKDEPAADGETDKEGTTMTHNVFEKGGETKTGHVLTHDAMVAIVAEAKRSNGSLREALNGYALEHGIENIDLLFPEAQNVTDTPEWIKRRTEWVSGWLGGTRKTPFSRIKTMSADLTFEDARAKGYIKGTLKKEEFFGISRRITTPQTVYKKQKLDRDDIIDITDFDVVAWMKGEMRVMLDEEVARAGLIGDGRDVADEDKIQEDKIRPIAHDDEFYVVTVNVNINDAASSAGEIIDAIIGSRQFYKGSGTPTMYTTETYIAQFSLLKDGMQRRMYTSMDQLASELRVSSIVPVEVLENDPDVVAIIVNPTDYVYGATRGGEVSLFDDFDIDYNQYKYLIETRCCGALVKAKSAIVVRKTAGTDTLVSPSAPTFDGSAITIVDTTGVVYKDQNGTAMAALGNPHAVAPGTTTVVTATPTSGHYFSSSEGDTWSFTNEA
jgi:HK97 family phage prohead protease